MEETNRPVIENNERGHDDTSQIMDQKLSKNQIKKLRKREKWLEIKKDKRKEAKSKRKKRLADLREKGEAIGPSRKSLKSNTMKNSSCKIKVVLDLSFDECMADKDITSLTSQIQHSYSANRRAENPMQLHICGLSGRTKKRLDDIGDYKGWDIHVENRSYNEVFPKESIVYLSSESPNVLSTLSEEKVYIIGGLVDHNSQKGLCHRLAEEKEIAHAQLPISEYLSLQGRKVLAVNHVVSILLRYTELGDWKQAFLLEMPQRKGFRLREVGQSGNACSPNGKEETVERECVGDDSEKTKNVEDSVVCYKDSAVENEGKEENKS